MELNTLNFGQLGFAGGSPRLSSRVLGVDIGALVEGLVEARRLPNLQREVQISANTAKLAALSELENRLATLRAAAERLSNPSLGADAFATKAAFVQSSTATPANQILGMSTAASAERGTFELTVERLARADAINGAVTVSDPSDQPLGADDTLTINGVEVALTAAMTLAEIRDAINAASAGSGVRASVVKVSDGEHRLALRASETGAPITLADGGTALADLGLAESGETAESLAARLTVNGLDVYRPTNSVDDLVDGVSIELFRADPGNTLRVEVDHDLDAVRSAVLDFVEAYNQLRGFILEQRAVADDGTAAEHALLFNDSLTRGVSSGLGRILSGVVEGLGAGALNNLRDIGLTFTADNRLAVNQTKLDDALLSDFEAVRGLVAFRADQEGEGFVTLARPESLPAALAGRPITVRVLETDAEGRPVAAELELGGVTTAATIDNGFIKGPAGGVFAGFTFGYDGPVVNAGDPARSSVVTPSQGLADRLGVYLGGLLAPADGAFVTQKESLAAKNTRLEAAMLRLDEELERYRETLIARFAAVERATAVLNGVQSSLQAFLDSFNRKN